MLEAEQMLSQTQSGTLEETICTGEPRCENCGAAGQNTRQSWCRQCGYYGVLGRCVELDQEWEAAVAPPGGEEAEAEEKPSLFAAFRAIPGWIWPLLGVVAAVTALTVAGRVLTGPPQSGLRIRWACLHLGLGGLALLAGQAWACMKASAQDSQFGPWDVFMRPFAIWAPAVAELPKTLRPLLTAVGGATAVVAVLTVGGFPYDYIFSGEIAKQPPSSSLVKAIANQAESAATGEEDLGESIKNLAEGEEGLEDANAEIERPSSLDCLILGYVPSQSSEIGFTALLIAAPVGEEQTLQFVATVQEGLTPEVRADLKERFAPLVRPAPFVACSEPGAVWLDPALTCRIRFVEWAENDTLVSPMLESILQKVEAP